MSDCRFGVSPVNYPDPDPDPDVQHILTKLLPNESLDIAHYLSNHICTLLLLHIHEVSFN